MTKAAVRSRVLERISTLTKDLACYEGSRVEQRQRGENAFHVLPHSWRVAKISLKAGGQGDEANVPGGHWSVPSGLDEYMLVRASGPHHFLFTAASGMLSKPSGSLSSQSRIALPI